VLSRSSFRTELDGSAKLLGGGGVRTHNQHTRIHRHHQLRAPIPCASAETEAMESPADLTRSREGRSYSYGGKSTRERQEARRARGATDRRSDPRTHFHARASPCFTDPSRKVQHRPRPRFRPAVLSSYPGVRGSGKC
jgi:hypothetical protein